jgi:hypothetical protein
LVREGVPEQNGDEGDEVALSKEIWPYRQLISTRVVWVFFCNFWLLSGTHAWWGKQKINSRQVSSGNTPVANGRKSNNKMSGNSGVYKCIQNDDESDGDWMRRSAATAIVGAFQQRRARISPTGRLAVEVGVTRARQRMHKGQGMARSSSEWQPEIVDISGEQIPDGEPEVVDVSGEQDLDGRRSPEAEVEEIDLTGPEPSGKVVHATLDLVDVDGYVPFPAWDDGAAAREVQPRLRGVR